MESNVCPEDSINSIKFQANQEKVDLGIGRLYECIFCKRGFNTAQALGGHMNIHRKDRARDKENSSKQQVIFSGPRSYQKLAPPPSTDNHCNSANTHLLSCDHHLCSSCCSACFLGSNSRANPSSPGMNSGRLRRSSSLESPPVTMDELKRTRGVVSEEELDLELRLGYDS